MEDKLIAWDKVLCAHSLEGLNEDLAGSWEMAKIT